MQNIEQEIRSLKREKNRLIALLEDPESLMDNTEADAALAHIPSIRKRIAALRGRLAAGGVTPRLTRAEERAARIEEAIPRLTSLELSISGYPTGRRRYFAELGETVEIRMQNACDGEDRFTVTATYGREELLEAVRALAPWDYKCKYIEDDPTGEGLTWELCLRFQKRPPLVIYGRNGFPYNFDDLLDLFGASTPFDEEEEEEGDAPEGVDLDAILADYRAELRELEENRRRRAIERAGMTEDEIIASMAAEYAAIYEDAIATGMDIMLVGDEEDEDGNEEDEE